MANEKEPKDRRWTWLAALILLILVFFLVRSLTKEHLPVRVALVEHKELDKSIATNGRVEPEVNYELHSPLATTVKAVYVQPGDVVPAGKLLMVLNDLEARAHVATAQSGVKAAEAALESATHNGSQQERQTAAADMARAKLDRDQARRNRDALNRLKATGAASGSEVSSAEQQLASAEATLRAAEESAHSRYSTAEVARAQAALADAQAGLATAREVLARTAIHAPVAGTVYSVSVAATEFAEEGKLLIQVADLRHERVRAYFDEPEIGNLQVGQKIQITWDAKQDRIWNGHIERVPVTVITYGTRNVGEVIVKIDDADGQLLPDTNVKVKVTLSSEASALSIPRDALHSENGQPFVYKKVNGELKKTPVKTGTITLTRAAILSGLQDGDVVALGTSNGMPLQEGIPVKDVQ